ncbi:MAG TPA: DUF4438 domain-containing protein [Gaiellales bacterium]|nr:DUF4438 domain-containing protein [Gaiellales bacterium]
MSGARANLDELVVAAVVGRVTTPVMAENPYEVGADGTPFVPVGAGGICYNVKVGMAAMGWAADQVEPGVSIANPAAAANDALAVFACVGNPVTVRTGAAAGATGTVTGKHESFRAYKHVLVHLDDDALEQVAPGDELLVRACGRGMAVAGAPGIACHSLGPELWRAWEPAGDRGRVAVAVTRILPPEVVGMGSGRVAAATSFAIQTKDDGVVREHGLDDLRLGDLVAVRDWDATHYTGYREGGLTVGVVASGDSPLAGNGPAVTVLLSAADGSLEARADADANLAAILGLG